MGWAERALVAGGIVAVSVGLVACKSDDGSTPPKTVPKTTTTSGAPKVKGVQVNLMLSGDRTAAIVGTKGSCEIPAFGAPVYEFKGSDYPDLGPAGSVRISGPVEVANGGTVPATARILIGDIGLLAPLDGAGITVSSSGRLVSVDTSLAGGPGITPDNGTAPPDSTVQARLTGTIRCT
jgi:hypothetical protein